MDSLRNSCKRALYFITVCHKYVESQLVNDFLNFLFSVPPANLEITTEPEMPRAGQLLTITCKSGTSNPASVLTWWSDGRQLQVTNFPVCFSPKSF